MPLCNGYDATEHIRTKMKNKDVIIIALTANSTNEAKERCIAAGMNDYFNKVCVLCIIATSSHTDFKYYSR